MEQTARCVLAALLPSFPQLRDAKHVEWWAHSRAHEAGHQMHWDSDSEGFPTGAMCTLRHVWLGWCSLLASQC